MCIRDRHRTERLEELRASIAVVRKQMDAAGQALTRARQDSAPRLAASIVRHSRELGFRQAVFEVSLSPLQEPGSQGMETASCWRLKAPWPTRMPPPCWYLTK